jgi:hypothetical protein
MGEDGRPALSRTRRLLLVFLIVAAAVAAWSFVLWAFNAVLRALGG